MATLADASQLYGQELPAEDDVVLKASAVSFHVVDKTKKRRKQEVRRFQKWTVVPGLIKQPAGCFQQGACGCSCCRRVYMYKGFQQASLQAQCCCSLCLQSASSADGSLKPTGGGPNRHARCTLQRVASRFLASASGAPHACLAFKLMLRRVVATGVKCVVRFVMIMLCNI